MNKEKKEPNLRLSLAAASILFVLFLLYLIDFLKQQSEQTVVIGIVMAVPMGACAIALLWAIWHIFKRLKS